MGRVWMVVCLSACVPVEEAPEDLNALLHQVWDVGATEDPQLGDLLTVGYDLVDAVALEDAPTDGALATLTLEQVADLGLSERSGDPLDPALAAGIYYGGAFPCSAEAMADVLTYPDQNALYDNYDAYARDFYDDRQAFLDGDADVLGWSGNLAASIPLAGSYTYDFETRLVRVPWRDGTAFVVKNWMPDEADWPADARHFRQDYQLELFLLDGERAVHLYGMWREMDLGALGTSDSLAVQRVTLNQTAKIDKDTARYCEEGVP